MRPNDSIAKPARKVLLIENVQADRYLLRNWLQAEKMEVYEADDIHTGIAACLTFQPDLILLELRLPTWSGYEVIRRLKNDPKTLSIPVIFIADSALTGEKAKGIDMGAVDFISKPFDPVELVARVGSALRTKALLDLLEQRAHLDGLTELGNRFALRDRFPYEWESCRREENPMSVFIADLDHFKKINDQFGHAAGDEVLRQSALTLRRSVREGDFVARYGGEEFVVVAPNCDLDGAVQLAERFRGEIADLKVCFRSQPIQVTCSVGVALVSDRAGSDALDVLDQADRALFHCKDAGRNAVWVWDPVRGGAIPSNRPASEALARAVATVDV
ncbi:response regulator receiver modulated diguanylate cyclase [Singulisphaera sp. GP187]|uniref:GGDEF domain-containing response regulator n=1 Tax=Singulisphaera sp. GP187 TaxID=1882752 RepID=UPI00092CC610|nr:diguanylate cyclase [Singulisphaera sp. GP187]SIO57796.1 response regulator receiver modulated diguanylate cyclase [Singulisphaera sp. GP187]